MFEEMNMIVLSGKEYPMKCDNLVLEKVQDKYEDLGKYENMLNGFVPELDEYGEEVRNEDGLLVGHYKMPDIEDYQRGSGMVHSGGTRNQTGRKQRGDSGNQ